MSEAPRPSPLQPLGEWHSRGYVPHWEAGETPQSINFRLADSMPASVHAHWQAELVKIPVDLRASEQRRFLERTLDASYGEALLRRADIAKLVEDALLFFDATRYRLHAWCVMPNHVHVLATPILDHSLSAIIHGWKSFTARQINLALGRKGQIWYAEYYDRKIRTERHFEVALYYIEQNPVKARLCKQAKDWVFSSASRR
jgi:putative transposase